MAFFSEGRTVEDVAALPWTAEASSGRGFKVQPLMVSFAVAIVASIVAQRLTARSTPPIEVIVS